MLTTRHLVPPAKIATRLLFNDDTLGTLNRMPPIQENMSPFWDFDSECYGVTFYNTPPHVIEDTLLSLGIKGAAEYIKRAITSETRWTFNDVTLPFSSVAANRTIIRSVVHRAPGGSPVYSPCDKCGFHLFTTDLDDCPHCGHAYTHKVDLLTGHVKCVSGLTLNEVEEVFIDELTSPVSNVTRACLVTKKYDELASGLRVDWSHNVTKCNKLPEVECRATQLLLDRLWSEAYNEYSSHNNLKFKDFNVSYELGEFKGSPKFMLWMSTMLTKDGIDNRQSTKYVWLFGPGSR